MNSRIKIGIFIAGAFLELFFAFWLAQTVHTEDVPPHRRSPRLIRRHLNRFNLLR